MGTHKHIPFSSVSTASISELEKELDERLKSPMFPLHVFPDKLKPLIQALHSDQSMPRSYIGTSILAAYSTAIGTSYHVETVLGRQYLSLWACLEGISSSGKSLIYNVLLKPIEDKHSELLAAIRNTVEHTNEGSEVKQIIVNETNMATLLNEIVNQNPKGVLYNSDEILGWVNGMNKGMRGVGNDEELWMTIWNSKQTTKRLSKGKVFFSECPYIVVFGGIQPSKLVELFKNGRDDSGFIYRILFAEPERHQMLNVSLKYKLPEEWVNQHVNCINHFVSLEIDNPKKDSIGLTLSDGAIDVYENWKSGKINRINSIKSLDDRSRQSSVFGKFSEYTLRFAGTLHLMDNFFNWSSRPEDTAIGIQTMNKAISLSDYFHETAKRVTERVFQNVYAPSEVLQLAALIKRGYSNQKIGDLVFDDGKRTKEARKKMAERRVKSAMQKYPRIFGAINY